jgi:hypothetical protein
MLEWQIKKANPTTVSNIYCCLLRSDMCKYFTFMAFHFHIRRLTFHSYIKMNFIFFFLIYSSFPLSQLLYKPGLSNILLDLLTPFVYSELKTVSTLIYILSCFEFHYIFPIYWYLWLLPYWLLHCSLYFKLFCLSFFFVSQQSKLGLGPLIQICVV